MGKGSKADIKLTPLHWELIRKMEHREKRIDILHNLGYEVCKMRYQWYYRKKTDDPNRPWTLMDKPVKFD